MRRAVVALLVTSVAATCARVHAQADLAGSYQAGTETTTVDVSAWGDDCGPRPRSSTSSERATVNVKAVGNALVLAFPHRTLRSDSCWSPNPAVHVTKSTPEAKRFRTECQTAKSDAKRERGIYTLTASATGVLELLEESNYDWQLNASRCVAKMRVTQRLSRADAAKEVEKPAAVPTPPPEAAACTPGPLARLRLRPTSLQLAPGERACFSVRAIDANGCVVPNIGALKWDLQAPAGATATLSGGCFKAATSAADAEGEFHVTVSQGSVRDEAVVRVATADLSDITARRTSDDADTEDSDAESGASSFGIEAAVKRSSAGVKFALGTLLLAMIAGAGWVAIRSGRKRDVPSDDDDDQFAPVRPPRSAAPPANAEQLICPTCRHGYPPGTTNCPRDGSPPIPYSEFTRRAQADAGTARTCPSCGAQLAPGAVFCGECGAKIRS